MNYIQEINEFYDWIELHPMSKAAISLWYALMHMNNKANWIPTFTVALSTLETKTGFKTCELYKARIELASLGMIRWKPRGGNQCAIYQLVPFSKNKEISKLKDLDMFNALPADEGDDEQKNTHGQDLKIQFPEDGNCETNGESNGKTSGESNGESNESLSVSINKQNETKLNNLEPIGSLSSADDLPCQNAVDVCKIYNLICDRLPEAASLTNSRKQNLNRRLKEHGEQNVRKMLRLAAESDFLAGDNNNSWVANIDWLFRASNFIKVLDGCYNMKPDFPNHRQPPNYGKPSVYEVLKEIHNL